MDNHDDISDICPFCRIASVELNKIDLYDTPLISTDNFFVVTGLGHFMNGYLLICTKKHTINFGSLDEDQVDEFLSLKNRVRKLVRDVYNVNPIFFEHGPSVRSKGGGCIDHAHLHVMPVEFNELPAQIARFFSFEQIIDMSDYKHFTAKNLHYLYFECSDEKKFICWNDVIPCQYFRQIVAARVGMLEQYNWRLHKFEEMAIQTWKQIKEKIDLGHNA